MAAIAKLPSSTPPLPPSFPIYWRGDLNYEHAVFGRVFNHRRPKRSPLAVVEATREEHVVEAVKLATKLGAEVSVRSGGHSWAAWSVRDDAILIDLGRYYEVALDESSGIAKVSPSTTGRFLNKLLAEKGRMFPGGHCPDVGIGGFILQGGMGWNCKNLGWACERMKAIDVVTADGRQLHCNEDENSDLLWAARGAGPGFPAVVTRFYLETIPAYSCMRSSAYSYPKSDYRKALNWVLGITANYDSDTEIVAVSSYPPGGSELCITVLLVAFKNSESEARAALQPAEDSAPSGTINKWFAKQTSLAQEYDDQHCANPPSHRYCADNCYVRNDADVASVLEEAFTTLPSKKSFTLWYSMAPGSRRKIGEGGMKDMALSIQTDHYFATYTVWENENQDEPCQQWVRSIMSNMERHSEGAYLGDSDFQVRRTRFWGEEQGKKLMSLRREWDPEGRIAGYLDSGDKSGVDGLENRHEWQE